MTAPRPLGVLIAALGGDGGGVLTGWIVGAAMRADLPVQSTSIPGVAQRTGATTYYVEVFPQTNAALAGRRLVMGLYPSPGEIDAMIATEVMEAGRVAERGFVTPDRTTLIVPTRRVYATIEKMAMADGRADGERVLDAARALAKRPIVLDVTDDAALRDRPLNAVLLGALAGAGVLPIPAEAYTAAIEASGIAVKANLAGFAAGLAAAQAGPVASVPQRPSGPFVPTTAPELMAMIEAGIARCVDYLDADYGKLYSRLVGQMINLDNPPYAVSSETARRLALWMTYEDVIRVADLKTRADRLDGVRGELRAKADEPVHVTEFLKPGIAEMTAIMPRRLGGALQRWAERRDLVDRLHFSMRLRTTTIWGYLRLRFLARLKPLRRRSLRFFEETTLIQDWLTAIGGSIQRDPAFALEVAKCAQLMKGYGDTHRRGRANYAAVYSTFIAPVLAQQAIPPSAAAALRSAREAALADPDGKALTQALAAAQAPAPVALVAE